MLHLPQSFLKNQKVAKDFVRYLEKCEDRVQEIYKMKKGTVEMNNLIKDSILERYECPGENKNFGITHYKFSL